MPMYDLNGNYSMFVIYRRVGFASDDAAPPIMGEGYLFQLFGIENGEEVYLKSFENFQRFLDEDLPRIIKPGVRFRTPSHTDISGGYTGIFPTDEGAVVSIVTGLNQKQSVALAQRVLSLLSGKPETKTLDKTVNVLLAGSRA